MVWLPENTKLSQEVCETGRLGNKYPLTFIVMPQGFTKVCPINLLPTYFVVERQKKKKKKLNNSLNVFELIGSISVMVVSVERGGKKAAKYPPSWLHMVIPTGTGNDTNNDITLHVMTI